MDCRVEQIAVMEENTSVSRVALQLFLLFTTSSFASVMSLSILSRRLLSSPKTPTLCVPLSRSLLVQPCLSISHHRSFSVTMPPKNASKHNNKDGHEHLDNKHSEAADESHQFQSGARTDRKEDEWKHRAPYRIHEDDEKFDVKWKGGCHCGKVRYQLSREKPLATKFCHCSTCQRLHGVGDSPEI